MKDNRAVIRTEAEQEAYAQGWDDALAWAGLEAGRRKTDAGVSGSK